MRVSYARGIMYKGEERRRCRWEVHGGNGRVAVMFEVGARVPMDLGTRATADIHGGMRWSCSCTDQVI